MLILFLCIICSTMNYAQEKEPTFIYENFTINNTYALFGDNVKLRAEPNTSSEVVTIVRIGEEITILKKTNEFLESATSKSAWYEVKYKNKKGFLAGKFIANTHKKSGNEHFYFRKYTNTQQGVLYTRIVHNETTKAYTESTLKLMNENIGVTFKDANDLKNVLQIVEVNYYGDSCGEESGKTVLFLNDAYKLIKVADLSEIGDGGVYGLSENFTYTYDEGNGKPVILFTKNESETVDENGLWTESRTIKRYFTWNGTKLVPEFSKEFYDPKKEN